MWGYVGHPSISKSTRKSQNLFLNGRWIQDRSLQHALTEAYRGLLMIGRQPISFLFLEVPAEIVDVNVHPTKTEVRFADSQALFRQLLSMLRTKFLSLNFESTMHLPSAGGGFSTAGAGPRPRGVELQTWQPASGFGASNTPTNSSLWSNAPRPPTELPRVGATDVPPESEISNFKSPISEPATDLASFAMSAAPTESQQLPAETHASRVSHGELRAMQRGTEFALNEDTASCAAYAQKVRAGGRFVDETRIEERRRPSG